MIDRVRTATALVIMLLSAVSVAASTTGLLPVPALAARAELVVVGQVVRMASEWNARRTMIHTGIDLLVEEVLKGAPGAGDQVRFQIPGGRVGDAASAVAGTPSFAEQERVLVFLSRRPDGTLGLVDGYQGKFALEKDATTGAILAVRRAPGRRDPVDRIELQDAKQAIRAR